MKKKKAKKKSATKPLRSKRNKTSSKKKVTRRKAAPKKKLAARKAAPKKRLKSKKTAVKAKTAAKRAPANTQVKATKRRSFEREPIETDSLDQQQRRSRSAGQSGSLQGLSGVEEADSESVDELVEEGNAFEADVVAGVEAAGDSPEEEVRTHEVSEDDVPEEYLDEE